MAISNTLFPSSSPTFGGLMSPPKMNFATSNPLTTGVLPPQAPSSPSAGIKPLNQNAAASLTGPAQTGAYGGLLGGFSPLKGLLTPPTVGAVKKVTDTDGNSIEYHAPDPAAKDTPPAPAVATPPTPSQGPFVPERVKEVNDNILATGGIAPSAQGLPNQNPVPATLQGDQSPTYGGVINSLVKTGTEGDSEVQNLDAAKRKLQESLANQIYNINTSGADLAFKQGEANQAQNKEIAMEGALETGRQNALQEQSQKIGALGAAASGIKPEASFPFVFNPATGTFSNASTGALMTPDDAAQAYIDGKLTSDQAQTAVNYLGSTAASQLQAAIIKKGGNPLSLGASSAANAGVISQNTSDIANISQNIQAADSNLDQLLSLAKQSNINDLGSVTLNSITNKFKGEFGNSALLSYKTLLAGARSLYASVLASRGETPTQAGTDAATFVPDNIPLNSLHDLYGTIKQEAQNVISAKRQQITGAQSSAGTNDQSNATKPTGWL